MRVLVAQVNPGIGDLKGNVAKVLAAISQGRKDQADLIVLPELVLSGYPTGDFLLLSDFIDAVEQALQEVIAASKGIALIVGVPRRNASKIGKTLFNSAAVIDNGSLLGFQDKTLLPTYDVFDERRYFEPADHSTLWQIAGKRVGITICEDIWQHSAHLNEANYSCDPIIELRKLKPDYVVNLSASPFSVGRSQTRLTVCSKAAVSLGCPLVLCNQVGGNDSLIFDGRSLAIAADGTLLACAKKFSEDFLIVDLDRPAANLPADPDSIEDLFQALVLGVRDYFWKSGLKRACLGLSGGIDSAVVACIAAEALGAENILGVGMPSRYSSQGSLDDARQLAENLKIGYSVLSVELPFKAYLDLLSPEFEGKPVDVTEENLQARIRGMILMALSNKHGYVVLSTGNKSEVAVGYATLYGDMCGGLAVLSDVTKRQVYALANWINRKREIIPISTIQKPPSAELRPNQKDSDSLPDYDIIDNVIEAHVENHLSCKEIVEKFGYSEALVDDLIKKIHRNEFKRRQSAPGLRVTGKAFNAGRNFPIVQGFIR